MPAFPLEPATASLNIPVTAKDSPASINNWWVFTVTSPAFPLAKVLLPISAAFKILVNPKTSTNTSPALPLDVPSALLEIPLNTFEPLRLRYSSPAWTWTIPALPSAKALLAIDPPFTIDAFSLTIIFTAPASPEPPELLIIPVRISELWLFIYSCPLVILIVPALPSANVLVDISPPLIRLSSPLTVIFSSPAFPVELVWLAMPVNLFAPKSSIIISSLLKLMVPAFPLDKVVLPIRAEEYISVSPEIVISSWPACPDEFSSALLTIPVLYGESLSCKNSCWAFIRILPASPLE